MSKVTRSPRKPRAGSVTLNVLDIVSGKPEFPVKTCTPEERVVRDADIKARVAAQAQWDALAAGDAVAVRALMATVGPHDPVRIARLDALQAKLASEREARASAAIDTRIAQTRGAFTPADDAARIARLDAKRAELGLGQPSQPAPRPVDRPEPAWLEAARRRNAEWGA